MEGGLKMPNIKNFISTLKISWLRRLSNDSEWKELCIDMYPELQNLECFGIDYVNTITRKVDNPFWKDVMKHYKELSSKTKPENIHDFMSECIQYNPNILRAGKTLYIKDWCDQDIFLIRQLINNDGNFLNHNEFREKYPGTRTNFLLYEGIIQSVKAYQNRLNVILTNRYKLLPNKTWFSIQKGNQFIQEILNRNNTLPTAVVKWNQEFENLDWKKIFIKVFKTTSDIQLRWFQTRLIHRILPTQKFLYACQYVDSPFCNFCNGDQQSLLHLMFDCHHVQNFWNCLQTKLIEKCVNCQNLEMTKELIIFGLQRDFVTDRVIDWIILLAKFYVYKCKIENMLPNFQSFMVYLKQKYNIEKYNATVNGVKTKFDQNWSMYATLVN